ncbi:hypothetical protein ACFFTM_13540 [Pseudoduganella plicata]|uniref:DUF5683 domain-containing protein n=2 Tax=Pseudoduganella plicata TaxID=321984 RepID=A0ABX5S5L2_9BURK|nr:hypothetical protein [Pseudoduganella plicata]QBQ35603.1 hypothetical protein E1742_05045 [Pseudoduganella plicata]
MKTTTKAALISALFLPGLGQLIVLKRPARAFMFIIAALLALLYLLSTAFTVASQIADQITAGTLPLDPQLITQQIEATNTGPGGNIAAVVLLVAWIGSFLDALLRKP